MRLTDHHHDEAGPVVSWLQRVLASRRRTALLALAAMASAILVTRGGILFPFVVGWEASKMLVEKEEQLAALNREANECAAAATFLGSDEGKKLASKLLYDPLPDGERAVILKPAPSREKPTTGDRMNSWIHSQEQSFADWGRHKLRVVRRWRRDPDPAELDPAAAEASKSFEELVQEAVEEQSKGKDAVGGSGDGSKEGSAKSDGSTESDGSAE